MSVTLHPSHSLGFKRPLTQIVKRSLTISNPNEQAVAFKVKTTAPKLYCVRPNSGRVDAGESIEVSVMLQALPTEPPLSDKCKDKFLIQSTLITPEKETMSLQALWSTPETNEEGRVYQQKLRVTYLPADGEIPREEDEPENISLGLAADHVTILPRHNGHTEHSDHPDHPVQTTLHATVSSVDQFTRENSNEDTMHEVIDFPNVPQHPIISPPRPPAPELVPESSSILPPSPGPASEPQLHPGHAPLATATTYVASPLSIATETESELASKLSVAQAEIERLRATIATMTSAPPTELRHRGRAFSDITSVAETDIATVVEEPQYQQPEGVPLQVVVIIALGVFITTYLFF